MNPSTLAAIGCAILVAEALACWLNGRRNRSLMSGAWTHAWRLNWALGIALAVSAVYLMGRFPPSYRWDAGSTSYAVTGLPFAFDLVADDRTCYGSGFATILDLVVWCFFPQLVLAAWAMLPGSRRRTA